MNYIFRLAMLLSFPFLFDDWPFKWFGDVLVSAKLSEKALENILFATRSELKPFLRVTNQTRDFQQHVLSQVYNIFDPSPTQPSFILFLFPPDSEQTADCLVDKLQKIVSRAFKDKMLISFDSQDIKDEHDKQVIKSILSEKFRTLKKNHVAILRKLEQLPPEAVMVLREYLDNEKVVRKRTLIILTMKKSLSFDFLSKESIKNDVEKTLEGLWKGKVGDADIAAILSRITSAIVPVKPESRDVITTVCPEKDEL